MKYGDGNYDVAYDNYVSIVSLDAGRNLTKVDARLGRGPNGEQSLFSKASGSVYKTMSIVKNFVEKFLIFTSNLETFFACF